jgi:hypothetical protein
VGELRQIWDLATPDSINGDLERARALAALAAPEDRDLVETYIGALERLERWLHDL